MLLPSQGAEDPIPSAIPASVTSIPPLANPGTSEPFESLLPVVSQDTAISPSISHPISHPIRHRSTSFSGGLSSGERSFLGSHPPFSPHVGHHSVHSHGHVHVGTRSVSSVPAGPGSVGSFLSPSLHAQVNAMNHHLTDALDWLDIDGGNDPDDHSISSGITRPEKLASASATNIPPEISTGTASHFDPFSVAGTSPTCPFLTDEDINDPTSPFHRQVVPLRIHSGSIDLRGSQGSATTYFISFTSIPIGTDVHFGVTLGPHMQLSFSDDMSAQSVYRHRYVVICRFHGKFLGLDVCPSKTKSIYAFPLLITLRSHDRRHITGYLAHPFLRGSIGFDPTTKRSHQDLYLACPGWGPGGGIVSSYAGAITLLDGYRRLTGTATTPITSIPHRDIPRATSLCRSAPTRTPPVLRQYILNQLASLGAPDITLWDRLSTNHPSFPPYELPIRDPVLTTVHSRGEGDARPTSHIHLEGGDTHPRSVSTTPLSISESTSTPSEPSSSQLTQDQKTRQSLINRVSTNKKLHAMPMAGSSTFQTFRNNLELDLRGSAWHPRGKWILDY